jgi:hypothetical protein
MCKDICTKSNGSGSPYWTSCKYNDVTYQPLTTHIPPADIYTCGDGICQVSESPGSSYNFWACRDCPSSQSSQAGH